MLRKRTCAACTASTLIALVVFGCMKRKEMLTLAPDGGVTMQLEYEADSRDELYGGDAMPSAESGWKTELAVEIDKEGKETYTVTAEAAFASGATLPDRYTAMDDPNAELSARFPTTVTLEQRADGTYYHFHRVYPRRDWAQVETLRKMLIGDKADALVEKAAEDVTHADRIELVKVLAQAAMMNMITLARAAFLDVTPAAAQDAWLRIESGIKQSHEALDFARLATLMENPDKNVADRALAAEAEALETTALDGIVKGLREAGYSERQTSAFLDRFHWHERYYDITADLGDDAFEIVVEMPGEIVATDTMAKTNGTSVEWGFDGQLFRDRDLELMATSRVAK